MERERTTERSGGCKARTKQRAGVIKMSWPLSALLPLTLQSHALNVKPIWWRTYTELNFGQVGDFNHIFHITLTIYEKLQLLCTIIVLVNLLIINQITVNKFLYMCRVHTVLEKSWNSLCLLKVLEKVLEFVWSMIKVVFLFTRGRSIFSTIF